MLKTIKRQSSQPGGLSFSLFPNSQSRRQGVGVHHSVEGGSRNSSRGPSWARGPRCCRVLLPFAQTWEWCSLAQRCAGEGRRFCSPEERAQSSSQQQGDSRFCQHAHAALSIAPFLELLETALKHTQVVSRNTNLLRFWVVLWVLLSFTATQKEEDSRTLRARLDQEILCSGLGFSSFLSWYPHPNRKKKIPAAAIRLNPASPFPGTNPSKFPQS